MVVYHKKSQKSYQKQVSNKSGHFMIYLVIFGTYKVGDVLNCILEKGEVNYTNTEKYDNNILVNKVIDGSDIFINGKIVDDFRNLDKNYVYTLTVSATQQIHRIILEHMN